MFYRLSLLVNDTASDVAGAISEYTQSTYTPDFEILKTGSYMVEDVTQLLIGIVLVLIYLLIGLIIALDIAYLTLPFFQELVQRHRWDNVTVRNKSLISKDAKDALIEANTSQTGVSALGLYIKKKSVSLIMLAIITVLILSNYTIIKDILVKIITQFLGAFQ